MRAHLKRTALATFLGAVLWAVGCQSAPGTGLVDGAGAMPEDPRRAIQEARFREAVKGLDFASGLVVVTEPAGENAAAAADYHAQGLDRLEHNRMTGALTNLTLAVRTDPDEAVYYNSLGRALQNKGKGEHALAAFRTALALDADYTDAQYNLAAALDRAGQRDAAIAQMQRVLELDPRRAEAHERLAIWYYYTGDAAAAWRHVDAARDLGHEPPPQFLALLESQSQSQ